MHGDVYDEPRTYRACAHSADIASEHSFTKSHDKLLKSICVKCYSAFVCIACARGEMVVVAMSLAPQLANDINTLLCDHHVMHCDKSAQSLRSTSKYSN